MSSDLLADTCTEKDLAEANDVGLKEKVDFWEKVKNNL